MAHGRIIELLDYGVVKSPEIHIYLIPLYTAHSALEMYFYHLQ